MLKATLKWRLEYMPEEIRWVIFCKHYTSANIIYQSIFSVSFLELLILVPVCPIFSVSWFHCFFTYSLMISQLPCEEIEYIQICYIYTFVLCRYFVIRTTLQRKQKQERFTDRLTKINTGGQFLSWDLVVRLFLELQHSGCSVMHRALLSVVEMHNETMPNPWNKYMKSIIYKHFLV